MIIGSGQIDSMSWKLTRKYSLSMMRWSSYSRQQSCCISGRPIGRPLLEAVGFFSKSILTCLLILGCRCSIYQLLCFLLIGLLRTRRLLMRHLEELSIKFNCSNNGICHIDSFTRNMSYWVKQKLYFLISSCSSRFLSEY